jgi:hypothetical protein
MNTDGGKNRYSPFKNWISLIGLVIVIGSLFSFTLLFAMDTLGHGNNPYLGILTFIVAPSFLLGGMGIMLLGWIVYKRKLEKNAGLKAPSLNIDLSRAQDRKYLVIFVIGTSVFMIFAALGSYHTYHFAESVMFCGQTCHTVMGPEYTTYCNSPHANVSCTACHVGPGAVSFVKAKLNGVKQLKDTILNTYERPVTPPKHMRPASETCGECHWPKKYYGNMERTFTRYLSDEKSTRAKFLMMLKVGGGDPTHGPVGGIHWHMSVNNTVEYIATNDDRQTIPWVRLTDLNGNKTEYRSPSFTNDIAGYSIKKMDCLDCHNRPAHQFRNPSDSVDLLLSLGKIDDTLPSIKSNLVAFISHTNTTKAEGLEYIATSLKKTYPKEAKLETIIKEVQTVYANSSFPEMKADWKTYPDNIGHKSWPGCFRCHDGEHKTMDGKKKIEASNCNDCHIIVAQGDGDGFKKLDLSGLPFAHPDSTSDGKEPNCITCHAAVQ